MRVFADTEFTDFLDCELISIGLVSEDGREFYAELSDFDLSKCSDFVKVAVLPQLGSSGVMIDVESAVGAALSAWLLQFGEDVLICTDQLYDWELLSYLVRNPMSLEMPNWLFWENIGARLNPAAVWRFFELSGLQTHHALHDARALRAGFQSCASTLPGNLL